MVRSRLSCFVVLLFLAFPGLAQAQYAPQTLGLGPHVTFVPGSQAVMWGVAIEFSRYLESGFEFFSRVPLLIAQTPVGADTIDGSGRVFATGASLGVRYLFVEGSLRPWVGLQVGGVVLITQPAPRWFLGTGATLGLDWVLTESWSVGARAIYDVFIDLNRPWRHQLGGSLIVSVLF